MFSGANRASISASCRFGSATGHEAIITLADNRWLAQVIGDLRKILKLARLQQEALAR